ncbi:hypothetical protein [Stenotrophomonas virus Jojan60]|nr:hypothetical protein [Stenotrophomonas virus Jojan60]
MARTDAHQPGQFGRLAAHGNVRRSDRRRSRHNARQFIVSGRWDMLATREHARPIMWQCCDVYGFEGRNSDMRTK